MWTIQERIKKLGIWVASTQKVASNPNMDDSAKNMDNWKVVLKRNGGQVFTVYFSKGFGHNGKKPNAEEILDCLCSDAAGIENSSFFDNWCREYGYDADSRKAVRIWETCIKQTEKLKQFLGDDYNAFLFDTEKL